MGGVGWVVAHKILVTSPEAKFLFPFFWAFWGLGFGLGLRACQYQYNCQSRIFRHLKERGHMRFGREYENIIRMKKRE